MIWKFYKDKRGKWRWRVYMEADKRKRIVGASTQGYENQLDCFVNAQLFGYRKTTS